MHETELSLRETSQSRLLALRGLLGLGTCAVNPGKVLGKVDGCGHPAGLLSTLQQVHEAQ